MLHRERASDGALRRAGARAPPKASNRSFPYCKPNVSCRSIQAEDGKRRMRHFDTDSLETLVTIIDRGGFTAAGDSLGKTQAAVSVIVSRMEQRIGKRLLERSRRGVSATPAGEILIGYARRILSLEDEALASIV